MYHILVKLNGGQIALQCDVFTMDQADEWITKTIQHLIRTQLIYPKPDITTDYVLEIRLTGYTMHKLT